MHEELNITQKGDRGRARLLRVAGRLDGKTAPKLIASCEEARKSGGNLVLSMAEVSFIASSGVGALLSVAERYRGQGARLGFAAISPAVESVVGLLNLEQFLTIFPTEDEALASLDG